MEPQPNHQNEQAAAYQYRLLYTFNGAEKVLATFETPEAIRFPPEGISFGSTRSIVGCITSKALEHPSGGDIYRFRLSPDISDPINDWFFSIRAGNVVWYDSIHIPTGEVTRGQQILSKVTVDA